ncbi:MAG: prolipoprotein diacylglyceryl transferase [Microthrixaceae bacterium]
MAPLVGLWAFLDYDAVVRIGLGPLSVSPHGVGTAVGFLAGARLMRPAARRIGIDDELLYALLTRAAIGAVIGARLAYVINHLGSFDNPLEVFAIWQGGISLLGGITGGVIAALPGMRRARLNVWATMDAAAPGLALGILIGRIGDLIVADHLGKPTDFVLGYRCTGAPTASPCVAPIGAAVHQPALYDLASVTVLLAVLLVLRRHPLRFDGRLIAVFVAWYGTGRFTEDFFRIDETHGTGLTGSQWSSVAAVAVATYVLVVRRRTPNLGRWSNQSSLSTGPEPEESSDVPT